MSAEESLEEIGQKILNAARNELYLNFPYLDVALCGLSFAPTQGVTISAATDGDCLYYYGSYLADRYLRSGTLINRMYLHVILHCMLRHLAKKHGRNGDLWDLSCDIAAESILDELRRPCLGSAGSFSLRQNWYAALRRKMPVLTAEGIYRVLLQRKLSDYERAKLQREFWMDDHGLWDPQSQNQKEQSDRQDRTWQGKAEKTQTGLETVLAGQATGGQAVYEQVKATCRTDVDYRAFLRRFAVPREIMAVDGDAFDYIFYTYGLQLYGNLPLVEPLETREERRIEDFVIAIDTSMSTSGELVRQFLSSTYSILKSAETFTRKMNIRILQCDDHLRSDQTIHDFAELKAYMEEFELIGGSATDFRPVFAHVEKLIAAGAFSHLRGLLYFTDGMGIYPKKRPPYDVAFVMMEDPVAAVEVPPWAIRLTLTEPELARAAQETVPSEERDQAELAELPEL